MSRRGPVTFGGEHRGRAPVPRHERSRFLIVVQGEVTEREYFVYVASKLPTSTVQMVLVPMGCDPRTLVEEAARLKRNEAREAARSGDSSDVFDGVFAVCDVDHFRTEIHQARDIARNHGIDLILTNPCFELWLIWHVQNQGQYMDSQRVQSLARQLGLVKDKHLVDPEKQLSGKLSAAVDRARRQARHWDGVDTSFPDDNPSSGMPLLMNRLLGAVRKSDPGLDPGL